MTYFPITFAALGDTATVPTTGTETGTINFQYGYGSNYSASLQTDPNALQVDRLTFNYMINQLTGNWQALYQTGAVPFITAAQNQGSAYAYAAHALVGAPDGNLFYSLTSSNTTTPGTAPSSWHLVNPYNLKSRQVLALSGVTGGTYNFAPTGTGCTLTYTVSGGVINAVTAVAAGGTGYVVGDLLTPNAGNYDAVIRVLTVSAGAVATVQILNGGTGFTAGTAVATQRASSNVAKISLAGTLTSNASVILLNAPLQIIASNNTTGAFTTTFFISNGSGGSTGTGAVVPQGTIDSRAITLESSGATDIYQCASAALVDGLGTALPNNVTTNTQVAGTNNTTVATTAYADASSAAAALSANAGLQVYSATTTDIPGTYSGGTNPTFTATATGLISLDGVATALGQYNLLKDLSNAAYNGVYVVTTLGSTGVSTVWTRRTDYNSPTEINGAGPIAITNGTTQAGQSWILTTQVTTLGTDPLTYTIFLPAYSTIVKTTGTPAVGDFATFSGASTIQGQTPTQATALLDAMVGDSGSGGTAGLVPAPPTGSAAKNEVLGAGGTWVAPNVFVLNAKVAYGATGNGTTDDTTAIQNWLNAIVSTGSIGYLPQGTYKITSQLTLTYGTTGAVIRGDGISKSTLVFSSAVAAPNLLIQSTVSANGSDYLDIDGIGLQGTVAGAVLQIGLGTYADAHNEPVINMEVQNFSTSTSAEAVQINYVLNGRLRFIADVSGAGIAAQINQANFCTFEGSYSAIGGNGLNFGSGTNTGNVFLAIDIENVAYCVAIPSGSSNTISNTFIGGTYSYTTNGLSISAGSDNSCLHPGINPVSPATIADFLAGGTGMTIKTTLAIGQFTPTMPTSTTTVTNNYGTTAQVAIWGGTVTVVSINGYGIGLTSGTFILKSGDTIALTYSSAPTWYWTAVN